MSNVLVTRLSIAFGEPVHSVDPDAFATEIGRLTRSYPADVHNRAADVLIRSYRPTAAKPWPSPSEICGACADASQFLEPQNAAKTSHDDWTPKAVARAYELIRSPMGQQAADEGWVLALWNHCRKTGQLPDHKQIARCRRDADGFLEAYRVSTGSMRQLGDTMLARREKLARHAWGEEVNKEIRT